MTPYVPNASYFASVFGITGGETSGPAMSRIFGNSPEKVKAPESPNMCALESTVGSLCCKASALRLVHE